MKLEESGTEACDVFYGYSISLACSPHDMTVPRRIPKLPQSSTLKIPQGDGPDWCDEAQDVVLNARLRANRSHGYSLPTHY
jgi:hypothetical protein